MSNPLENLSEQKKNELPIILEQLHLVRGTSIMLIKRLEGSNSDVKKGTIFEGVLDSDVQIGQPIYLNEKHTNSSRILDIGEKEGHFFLKTETSIYELVKIIKNNDLEYELEKFKEKGYGEWDMFTGQVAPEDNPYRLLLTKSGFKQGDEVIYFVEKERRGIVDISGGTKTLTIRDENNNPWGIAGILLAPGGYIRKVTPEDK